MYVKRQREARFFLLNTGSLTTIGTLGPDESIEIVEELYKLGALSVNVGKIGRDFAEELYVKIPPWKSKEFLMICLKREALVEQIEKFYYKLAWE